MFDDNDYYNKVVSSRITTVGAEPVNLAAKKLNLVLVALLCDIFAVKLAELLDFYKMWSLIQLLLS